MLNHIDNLNINNPQDFWKHIQHLGDRNSRILLKVHKDGVLSSNEQIVTQTWHDDFKRLFNNNGNLQGDDEFYDNDIDHKCVLEKMMGSPGYISNELVNNPISFDEVVTCINRLKNGKTPGVDLIPNEILKTHSVDISLHRYFTVCFDSGCTPSIWLKLIIAPTPKNVANDPYTPFNYRGISLLSSISKLYTMLLNNRLTNYLEDLFLTSKMVLEKIDHVTTTCTSFLV